MGGIADSALWSAKRNNLTFVQVDCGGRFAPRENVERPSAFHASAAVTSPRCDEVRQFRGSFADRWPSGNLQTRLDLTDFVRCLK